MTIYNNIFNDGKKDFYYFNQKDPRWSNVSYAGELIGIAGCGPSCMAMVIKTLTGVDVTPESMAKWSEENNFAISGGGSYHALIPNAAKEFGLNVEGCAAKDDDKIIKALKQGKIVVIITARGTFATSGHFMVLRGITDDDKILLADPADYYKTQALWNLETFLQTARADAGAGGPFWIISK